MPMELLSYEKSHVTFELILKVPKLQRLLTITGSGTGTWLHTDEIGVTSEHFITSIAGLVLVAMLINWTTALSP